MTTTKTNALTDSQIAKLESKGFRRWTKGSMDRLYINAKDYGIEFDYYKTGNIRNCYAFGERVSNAEGYRFKATKTYIDLATGELHIQTATGYEDEIREAIEAIIAECVTEPETEIAEGKSKRTQIEERRDELCKTVEEFVAARIAASEGMPEDKRKQGIAMLEAAKDKTIAYIRSMEDTFVLTQVNDGRRLVQSYGLR